MQNGPVADAPRGNWVDAFAPDWLKPYARLARWDRPIGFWLLFWPCAFGIALAWLAEPARPFYWLGLIEMFIGAIAMRGAGCALNDIVDADIDARVERTRSRPIPSGQISKRAAAIFLALQALVGLVILLQFNGLTIQLGLASVVLIAIYPFMKRITWWPQLFLGLAFSWGALVGWTATTGSLPAAPLWLYAGCILWVIGYDTIYAVQDVEDDALVGVRSTARLFGTNVQPAVALFYAGALILWTVAAILAGAGWIFGAALAAIATLLFWQVLTLDGTKPGNALNRFKANNWVGLALTLAIVLERLF
jgi:4-hydroxybenzoate polyprenyltransferase